MNRALLMALRDNLPSAVPPNLSSQLLRDAGAQCPEVHSGTLLGTMNWLAQTIKVQKSPKFNCPRWLLVLNKRESPWYFNGPQPIRLWSGNAKIIRRENGIAVSVRLERYAVPGKKHAESTPVILYIDRPRASANRSATHRASYAAACEIADGTRKLAQSQLHFDGGKWRLRMTVEGAAAKDSSMRDKDRMVIVRPGRRDALRVRAPGRSGGFGETALDRVSYWRGNIDQHRKAVAASAGGITNRSSEYLSQKWRNKVKGVCKSLVADIARALVGDSCGKVLWLDGNHKTAGLALAGKSDERDSRELFPFHMLRDMAARSLERLGIEVGGRANLRSVKRRIADGPKRAVRKKAAEKTAKIATARKSTPGPLRPKELQRQR